MNKLIITAIIVLTIVSCQTENGVECANSDLSFTTTVVEAHCTNDGSIKVMATGGESPYSYFVDDGTGKVETTSSVENLTSGEYTVEVKDNLGCSFSATVTVNNNNTLTATATITNADCGTNNGIIEVLATGGTAPYEYQLGVNTPQSSTTFNVSPGVYDIIVKDANGCEFEINNQVFSDASYSTDIQPLLANSCATTGCHDGSGSLPNFSLLSQVQANASMIKTRTQNGSMPPNGTLTQLQKDIIACWVDDGARDN